MSHPPLKRKLVVLEESTLISMALNKAIVQEFPFLKGLLTSQESSMRKRGGCGGCSEAHAERMRALTSAKTTIAGLDTERKRVLKNLLNAEKVRLTYRDASGKIIQLTF